MESRVLRRKGKGKREKVSTLSFSLFPFPVWCSRAHASRGFTLIEILLVVILLGVLVGLVLPRVSILFFDYEFHSTVSQIEKLIRFAQSNAVLDNAIYRITIDKYQKSFSLSYKDARGSDEFQSVSDGARTPLLLPENMELSRLSKDAVFFFPDGSSTVTKFSVIYNNEQKALFAIAGNIHGLKVTYEKK